MKQRDIDNLMKNVDATKKPKHWRKFINKNIIDHNVILKCGNRAFCTHCQKYFDTNVKIHDYKKQKCKWCGEEYYVRNHNIKNISFFKDIAFYTKIKDKVVLRVFEIESKYNYKTRTFKQNLKEYVRFIPDIGIVINNAVSFYMWNQKVWHDIKIKKWHVYTGNKRLYEMPIYPYNKRRLFKGTFLEYAPIKEFRQKYGYYTYFEVLELASYQSFELLWKMGLHRLTLEAKHFNKKGNFEKRFGIPKKFLEFMIENDINYEEYQILKLIQKPDLELIKQYKRYDYRYLVFMKKQGVINDLDVLNKFYYDSSVIKEICKYVPLKKFLKYKKGIRNIHLYADYLTVAEKLGVSLRSKKRLFPYQLKAWHDKLCHKLEIANDIKTQFAADIRYLELSKYTYEDDKYMIFPAPGVQALIDEGKQQGNCVGKSYINPYINKETEIYLIRKKNNVTKSFITLEYKNNSIVQKELQNHNRNFTKEQEEFMQNWVNFRNFVDKREKYKNKNTQITTNNNYDLTKISA